MARTSARVVMNRKALSEVNLGFADGMLALAQEIVETANPPDATPFGEGLVTSGGSAAWVDGRKIGGEGAKPRGLKLNKPGITAIAGFGFPGRFQEVGTVRQPPRPFLSPAAGIVLGPEAPITLSREMQKRIGSRP